MHGAPPPGASLTAPTHSAPDSLESVPVLPVKRPVVGDRLGRYVVVESLGSGGMGFVVAAYDPELDRKVALKTLKRSSLSKHGEQRLRREAQALARLTHANVVTVYEVGRHAGQLFIAMEFIRGLDLRKWLEAKPRTWQEILATFIAAGEGLAAAHAAELVHRDFKPANVMVGEDGRVRVMDFGLARQKGEGEEFESQDEAEHPSPQEYPLDSKLTQTGALLGTPGYIAPELLGGHAADARADQFSFCVALFEALHGLRPYRGSPRAILQELEELRASGELKPTKVPSWLTQALVGGLEPDPSSRYPSMGALLDELRRNPAERKRRWLLGFAFAAALAGAAGLGGVVQRGNTQVDGRCVGLERDLDGVWDAPLRQRVEGALLETGSAHASETWARVSRGLDDYAQRWVEARTQACEATRDGLQSQALLDRRVACLDERRTQLDVLVGALAQATPRTTERAVRAVRELPSLEPCADRGALLEPREAPDDPELSSKVEALERRRVEIRTRAYLVDHAAELPKAEALVNDARALGYVPQLAKILYLSGWLDMTMQVEGRGRVQLEEAYEYALDSHNPRLAISCTRLLVIVHTDVVQRELAQLWYERGALLTRLHGDTVQRADMLRIAASLQMADHAFAKAVEILEQALATVESEPEPDELSVALILDKLAEALASQGQFERGAPYFERSLEIYERALGPNHPNLALSLNGYGMREAFAGHHDRGREHLQRGLKLALNQGSKGLESDIRMNLASLELLAGNYETAHAGYAALLPDIIATHGEGSYAHGMLLGNLGEAARELGHFAEARDLQLQALGYLEPLYDEGHPTLLLVLLELGLNELGLAHFDLAIELLERAAGQLEDERGEPLLREQIRFGLARALWEQGEQRARARELARTAALGLAALGDTGADTLEEVHAWLEQRSLE